MEEDVKERAKKEAEEVWENTLKKGFDEKIKKCTEDILAHLKKELYKCDNSINQRLEKLNNELEKKLKKGIEEAQSFSKKNSIKKQSKNIQKINNEKNLGSNSNNNMNIENNLNNNLNNNNIISNIDNNNNIILKDGNDLNTNINNNQNNIIDNNTNILNNFEEDEKLRKKIFKFESISNPRLINFPLVKNQNPLYNLIFQCLCNKKYSWLLLQSKQRR